ncbi:hypothetical protein BT96DRAFT_1001993, partial [Gymnopus androsaceus JB14]
ALEVGAEPLSFVRFQRPGVLLAEELQAQHPTPVLRRPQTCKGATSRNVIQKDFTYFQGRFGEDIVARDTSTLSRETQGTASSGPDTSMDFDISNLNSIVPAWKDKKYEGLIPDDVCREVLEEIFCMSFKEELLLLDRYLYTVKSRDSEEGEVLDDLDASTREERNIKVIGAVILDTDVLGGASASVDTRQNAFYGLFKVMNGWTKGPSLPDGSYRAGEKLSEMVSEEDLKFGEYCLAYHYILTYANFFKWPPTLPYRL